MSVDFQKTNSSADLADATMKMLYFVVTVSCLICIEASFISDNILSKRTGIDKAVNGLRQSYIKLSPLNYKYRDFCVKNFSDLFGWTSNRSNLSDTNTKLTKIPSRIYPELVFDVLILLL